MILNLDYRFIYCKDEDLSKELVKNYRLISKSNGLNIFANETDKKTFNFDKAKQENKIFWFSNKLMF